MGRPRGSKNKRIAKKVQPTRSPIRRAKKSAGKLPGEPRNKAIVKSSAPDKAERIVKETRHLPVQLTEAQIEERRHAAHRIHLDIGVEEERLKAFKETAKSRITTLEGSLSNTLRELDSGRIFEDVPCHRIYDYKRKVIRVVRRDTGEEVERSAMTKEDLQITIPGIDPTKPKGPQKEARKKLDDEGDRAKSELDARAKKGKLPTAVATANAANPDEAPKCIRCGSFYVKGLHNGVEIWVPNCDCMKLPDDGDETEEAMDEEENLIDEDDDDDGDLDEDLDENDPE
jgi:hypothetical protein